MMDGTKAIDAVLQTAHAVTSYRREGRGAPVLVLADAAARAALTAALAGAFRVYVPAIGAFGDGVLCAPAAAPVGGGVWLTGLIDGLALERPALVADAGFARLALRFAARERQRVGRIAVLTDDERAAGFAARLHDQALPALCVTPADALAQGAARLTAFLRDDAVDSVPRPLRNFMG
jgi:hypothetical protein